jgi:hypothetical protein
VSRYRILLILNIAYCCLAMITKKLPGWRMFEKVESLRYQLTDRVGRPIDLYEYLPSDVYISSLQHRPPIVSFICKRPRERAPFVLTELNSNTRREIHAEDCQISL